jgi:uncharacterized repeat protein (TIGR01451 family)
MSCSWKIGRLKMIALALCALGASGCASMKSGIDPSGERVFAAQPPPAKLNPEPESFYDDPLTQNAYDDVVVTLRPRETVAQVGAEVVLVAGVGGSDGYLRTNRRLEWTIAQGSVGHFVSVGENGFVDILLGDFNRPRKIDNSFTIGSTLRNNIRLNRGACSRQEDVFVRRGEGWVSLTSPVEGTSNVTVFAPEVYAWSERMKSAQVHWVDAVWQLPTAAIYPAGAKHVFLSTAVTRQSNHAPCEGWLVRYEIVDGPSAGFMPSGAPAVEAVVDATGQAKAEIFQKQPAHGLNKICIQVVRPGELPGAGGKKLVVEKGQTTISWTSSDLAVSVAGPATAAAGTTISYRINVSNPGDLPAKDVLATVPIPNGLTYLASNPAAEIAGKQIQWRLGELGPRQGRTIEVSFRAEGVGSVSTCCDVTAAGGLKVSHCAVTNVGAPPTTGAPAPAGAPTIDIKITGPEQATVGGNADFLIVVTNIGPSQATDLVIKDVFDEGLSQKFADQKNSLSQKLGTVAPNEQVRLNISFLVTKPGRLSHRVEVTGPGISPVSAQASLTAIAAGGTAPEPGAAQPGAAPAAFSVKLTGPKQQTVGETARFFVEVKNLGNVPLQNVSVVCHFDPALLAPENATGGFDKDALNNGELRWTMKKLDVGKAAELEIQCKCQAATANAISRVSVTEPGGGSKEDETSLEILPAGAPPGGANREPTPPATQPGLKMSVAGLTNPVTEGKNMTYEVRVTNQGTASYRNVGITATVPEGMSPDPVGTAGPDSVEFKVERQLVLFDPVAEIKPKEMKTYRIRVYAQTPARQRHFSVEMTSPDLPQPIVDGVDTEVINKPAPTGGT